jgi:hypothetical protein
VRADAASVLAGLRDVVGADRDHAAVADLDLAVQLYEQLGLSSALRTKAPAAQDQDQRMLALELGQLGVWP